MAKRPNIPESRDVLWQALRRLRKATARELAAVTERPKNAVQVDLRYLTRTGYVRVEGEDRNAIYTLLRDGVRPPMFILRGKELLGAVDRNTHERYGVDGGPPPDDETVRGRRKWCPKGAPKRKHRHRRGPGRRVIAPHLVEREQRKARRRGE